MRVILLVRALQAAKTRRSARRLRATMLAMETAAVADDLPALHRHTREQERLLQELRREGNWSDARLMAFLTDGEIVKSLHDPELEEVVGQKVAEAERCFGRAA